MISKGYIVRTPSKGRSKWLKMVVSPEMNLNCTVPHVADETPPYLHVLVLSRGGIQGYAVWFRIGPNAPPMEERQTPELFD